MSVVIEAGLLTAVVVLVGPTWESAALKVGVADAEASSSNVNAVASCLGDPQEYPETACGSVSVVKVVESHPAAVENVTSQVLVGALAGALDGVEQGVL